MLNNGLIKTINLPNHNIVSNYAYCLIIQKVNKIKIPNFKCIILYISRTGRELFETQN